MVMALEVLRRLGLKDIELRLSHAGLIRALLAKLGLSPEEQARIFDQILDGNTEVIAKLKPGEPERREVLSLLLDRKGKSSRFLKNLGAPFTQNLPELKLSLNNFINVVELLESLGYDYQIDIASGRGFEYYTGVIFQLFMGKEKLGGGGRYDALIPLMGGRDIPASGFALYLNHLMNLVKVKTLVKAAGQRILIRAESSQPEALKEGFSMANYLHEAGYMAGVHLGGQEPANLRWTLDIRSKAPQFTLTDQVKHKKFEVQTADKVLTLLGEEGADKDSVA
jgi:histidyl-tRNA synthetase